MTAGPLARFTVLDLTRVRAGPTAVRYLADWGANCIKVEMPPSAGEMDMGGPRHGPDFQNLHRNKRSVTLNLKEPDGKAIFMKMVEKADVVVENYRADVKFRLGIDYESLKRVKPDLIYCHTRGHETGPRAPLPGNDQTAGCLAGVQWEDGGMWRGGKPMWSLTSFGDTGNGFLSAIGMVQALYHRDRTGEGQMVDTAIVNAQLLAASYAVAYPDGRGVDRPKIDGEQYGYHALDRLYETADGWLCIVAANDDHWRRLCAVVQPSLATDPRFASAENRTENDAILIEILTDAFKKKSAADWFATLDAAGVPCEISDPEFSLHMHEDPELIRRRLVVSYPQHFVGRYHQIGLAFDFSDTPAVIQGPPLIVGEQTVAILTELGYSAAAVDELVQGKAVATWAPESAPGGVPQNPWLEKTA